MERNYLIAFLAVFLSFSSCSEGPKDTSPALNVPITFRQMDSEANKTVASLSVEGMTCAEGCGGKIQKELRALAGVKDTRLDYADDRKTNTVFVDYDPAALDELRMIECVQGLMDGMYKVNAVEVISYNGLKTKGKSADADLALTDFGRLFQILNLLQSLSKMLE